jgi:hypothetical protein
MITTLKTIEPHRRFSYDGAMSSGYLKDNSRNLPPIGQQKRPPINAELEDLERKISRSFFEGSVALERIREKKLYLAYFDTFEEYCDKRLGKSIRAVYEQLKTLEIFNQLDLQICAPSAQPALEMNDLQPLAKLPGPAKEIAAVAKKILKDNPKATAKEIASTIKSRKKPDLGAKFINPMPKEIDIPMPEDKQRAKRWNQVTAKLNAAKDRDEEGFLEALEKLLENWGL